MILPGQPRATITKFGPSYLYPPVTIQAGNMSGWIGYYPPSSGSIVSPNSAVAPSWNLASAATTYSKGPLVLYFRMTGVYPYNNILNLQSLHLGVGSWVLTPDDIYSLYSNTQSSKECLYHVPNPFVTNQQYVIGIIKL